MPRNLSTGAYSAPPGQPVTSGTSIDPTVYNTLLTDIGNEITNSLDARGETPMSGALNLSSHKAINVANGAAATDAAAYGQLAGAGIPVGFMAVWPSLIALPTGWLRATSGATASRSGNPNLFSLLGTLYGNGDGSTTFGLPNPGLDDATNHLYGIIKAG